MLLLGLGGIFWSGSALPTLRLALPAGDVTARLLAGDRFKLGGLGEMLSALQVGPGPIVMRGDLARVGALVRLRIIEDSMKRNDPSQLDRDAVDVDEALKYSLAFNPGESFLWLMLYSFEVRSRGFESGTLAALAESYATGPYEGWISLRRSRMALTVFPMLTQTLQDKVIAEFAGLVSGDFVEEAVVNLIGVGWPQRDRLLASLEQVDMLPREAFAKRLAKEHLRLSVPGIIDRWSR